jgi:hypothetical protein
MNDPAPPDFDRDHRRRVRRTARCAWRRPASTRSRSRARATSARWRDIPSGARDAPHVYSLVRAEPALSRRYSPSEEIWRYLRGVVDKCSCTTTRFGVDHEAHFDEASGSWTPSAGRSRSARAVISCVGAACSIRSRPIPGPEPAASLPTPRWNHDYDLSAGASR